MSSPRAEILRIAASMTVACAIGATLLGGVYVATSRYQEAARIETERRAVREMLSLDDSATVLEVHQLLAPARREVVYRSVGGDPQELTFTYDGTRVDPAGRAAPGAGDLEPLGRLFIARRQGALAGLILEGEARGYKNRIRYFVAVDGEFRIAGVRVLAHEEDPGLGAEIATPWFQTQFEGRPYAAARALDVTRDPMPEDWRAALAVRARTAGRKWHERFRTLHVREMERPIYAVTGATISSRALTDGVRTTVEHLRRRWELLAPYYLGEPSRERHASHP